MTPVVKIWQSVASEQPNEPVAGVPGLQFPHRINGVACPSAGFEVADADGGAARLLFGRRETGFEGRHILSALLERVARRDQPPDLVEPEFAHGGQADVPVPAMRRIERAAEEADARHARQLAWAAEAA
jgi:hypothetical protein